jgi:hypothetical protein
MSEITSTPQVPCKPGGCDPRDCPPCLDCGTPVHARGNGYHVDCGGVCVPCGHARYGDDDTEYLFGADWRYEPWPETA